MFSKILKNKYITVLWIFIIAYILYFSYFTILRYKTLYASYYDLGIMNQTVYNTYRAIVERNPSKVLELTNPMSNNQVKRMSIHNDVLLLPIALLYFIYSGPQTLLVLQTIVLALGALAVFKIAIHVLQKQRYRDLLALVFAIAYLLYPALERANIFDFHAVTLSTTFLLWMFYLWLEKKYYVSFFFLILSLFSKEQVGFTTAFFGAYTLWKAISIKNWKKNLKTLIYPVSVTLVSILWAALSFLIIVPHYRGSNHFAVVYYGDFGDSPIRILIGIMKNPYSVLRDILNLGTMEYLLFMLGPLAFLSLLSPIVLLIALPELAINLLSSDWNMRTIVFHYTAVITPFVFISAIYGVKKIYDSRFKNKELLKGIPLLLLFFTLLFAYFKGPLPFMKEQNIHPFKYPQQSMKEMTMWAKTLKDPMLKIAVTGHAAPLFSSREYLYNFSNTYDKADYVVLTLDEVYNYPEKAVLIPAYNKLMADKRFKKIYQSGIIEVYKKIL